MSSLPPMPSHINAKTPNLNRFGFDLTWFWLYPDFTDQKDSTQLYWPTRRKISRENNGKLYLTYMGKNSPASLAWKRKNISLNIVKTASPVEEKLFPWLKKKFSLMKNNVSLMNWKNRLRFPIPSLHPRAHVWPWTFSRELQFVRQLHLF